MIGIAVAFFAAARLVTPAVSAAGGTPCAQLSSLALPGVATATARVVGAGEFVPPAGRGGAAFAATPAFCRVEAVLTPVADSEITLEVWLPESGWNGRFQGVGNRGWGGVISYAALAQAVTAGYASASTDTGHSGAGARFALGHPEKVIDAGSRAVHEMTTYAKALVDARYGTGPAFSYWNGCSLGGRQGYAEAQQYPSDYNGIVVGDPANDLTHLYAARLAWALAVHRTPSSEIPASKLPVLHAAALAACDANDGVKDGVIEDPRRCRFDPKAAQCADADGPGCLTAEQVASARALYMAVEHPRTHETLAPGFVPGSELGWSVVAGPQPEANALDLFKYVVFQDPNWDWHTFNLATDVDRADQAVGKIVNATETRLANFFGRGGKLLIYHGWADPQTPPLGSVDYFERVVKAAADRSPGGTSVPARLFMVPGMGHCEGGDGTDTFDKVTPLADWVERGVPPTQILAAHQTNGKTDRTRPLCPIGQVARWTGTGDTDNAVNFRCVTP